jgi:hypothetical protein
MTRRYYAFIGAVCLGIGLILAAAAAVLGLVRWMGVWG